MATSPKTPHDKSKQKKNALPKSKQRQQILNITHNMFARHNYHQTTIDNITLQTNITHDTFYLYFEDKRTIFSDLIDHFASQLTMTIVRIVTDDPQQPIIKQVRENIRAIITTYLMERSMTKILFTDTIKIDPTFDRKLFTFYDTMIQLLTKNLKNNQTLNIIKKNKPHILTYLTIGALKKLLYQTMTLNYTKKNTKILTQQMYTFLSNNYLHIGTDKTQTHHNH